MPQTPYERRVQACLNACQDIPTEALEAGVVAELLQACEAVLARHRNHMVNWSIIDDVVAKVEAAIAKARGQS